MHPCHINPNQAEWKRENIARGYQSKIIASALSIPSNRATFFKILSVFNEIVMEIML